MQSGIDIRLNQRSGGGAIRISSDRAKWTVHDDTDIAILQMTIPPDADCLAFPLRASVNDDLFLSGLAGPGDDITLVGLFARQPGRFQNTPIVRTGTLAALPSDPIQTHENGTWPAYLIEARSTEGMSGFPVFLNMTGYRRAARPLGVLAKQSPVELYESGRDVLYRGCYLLGGGHGHFNHTRSRSSRNLRGYVIEKINTGIALVVPHERVLELTHSPKEKAMRRKDLERREKEQTRSLQAERGNTTVIAEPFEDVPKRASRTKQVKKET